MRQDRLYVELADGDLRLVKLTEAHREALRAVCAADGEIWAIYSSSFGPGHFDQSFDALIGGEGRMAYAIFDGDRLVGMTAWLRPAWSAQTIEIGNSYIHPDARGTGFNRRVKRLMIEHAFAVASAASNFASTNATRAARRRSPSWGRSRRA